MTPIDPRAARRDIEARSATLIEWPTVLARLAACAVTPAGKERCLNLAGSDDRATVEGWYAEVREWLTLREREGELPLAAGADARPALRAAVTGGLLDAAQCREIALVLDQARDVRRAVARVPELSRLHTRAEGLDEVPELRRAIADAIDPEGNLRESATPELARLHRERDRLRREIVERVEGLLASPEYEPWLQDRFVTQREDRYVLPIKIADRAKVGGIVHDLSASGATVFIEPEELVQANNALKWAELAIEQEIERIFRRLTDLAARHRGTIEAALDALTDLDVIQAKGRLGLACQGSIPRVAADGAVAWRGLRHPLLALRGVPVVPNDVLVPPGVRALVISGPNTGGKTVLLKAIGLAALMTRAGMPIPCEPESEAPLFPAVMMEVGDEQDLARDLSTFAGHIRVIAAMIETAPPDALVLIDELATATDPDEGTALARAVLETLMARRVLTVVTTHYTALKAWAAEASPGDGPPDRMSAGMGYDVDTLTPTYRLALGRPGVSLGLDVAARLGLPRATLDRARSLVAPQTAALARAIAALEAERQAAAGTTARLAALEAAAREAALRQDAAAAGLERERHDLAAARKTKIAAEVARAKREIDRLLETARREKDAGRLRTIRSQIDRVPAALAPSEPDVEEAAGPAVDFEAGARVRVVSLRADGVLLEATHGRPRVRVRVGDRDVSVEPSVLRPSAPSSPEPAPPPHMRSGARADEPPSETVTLIGVRVPDALARVDRALDEAAVSGLTRLRLLHGHGTGRLKAAIRAHLASSPYVASHRPGDEAEGGDAVTIVMLTT